MDGFGAPTPHRGLDPEHGGYRVGDASRFSHAGSYAQNSSYGYDYDYDGADHSHFSHGDASTYSNDFVDYRDLHENQFARPQASTSSQENTLYQYNDNMNQCSDSSYFTAPQGSLYRDINTSQGNQMNFEPRQGNQMSFEPRQGNQMNFEPHQGNQMNFETHQGNQRNFEPRPGNQMNFEPHQGNQMNFEPHQGNQMNFEPRQGNEMNFEPCQVNQMNFEPRQRNEMNFKPRQGIQMNFEPRQGYEPRQRCEPHQGYEPRQGYEPHQGNQCSKSVQPMQVQGKHMQCYDYDDGSETSKPFSPSQTSCVLSEDNNGPVSIRDKLLKISTSTFLDLNIPEDNPARADQNADGGGTDVHSQSSSLSQVSASGRLVTTAQVLASSVSPKHNYLQAWKQEMDPDLSKMRNLAYQAAVAIGLRRKKNCRSVLDSAAMRVPLRVEFNTQKMKDCFKCHLYIQGISIASCDGKKMGDSRRNAHSNALNTVLKPYLRIITGPGCKKLEGSSVPFGSAAAKVGPPACIAAKQPSPASDDGDDSKSPSEEFEPPTPVAGSLNQFVECNVSAVVLIKRKNIEPKPLDQFIILEPKNPMTEKNADATIRRSANLSNMVAQHEYTFMTNAVRCVLRIENQILADCTCGSKQEVKPLVALQALKKLQQICWTIKTKMSYPPEHCMQPKKAVSRASLGIDSLKPSHRANEFRNRVEKVMKDYESSADEKYLTFDCDYSKAEVQVLRSVAKKLQLRGQIMGRRGPKYFCVRRPQFKLFDFLRSAGGETRQHKLIPPTGGTLIPELPASLVSETSSGDLFQFQSPDPPRTPPIIPHHTDALAPQSQQGLASNGSDQPAGVGQFMPQSSWARNKPPEGNVPAAMTDSHPDVGVATPTRQGQRHFSPVEDGPQSWQETEAQKNTHIQDSQTDHGRKGNEGLPPKQTSLPPPLEIKPDPDEPPIHTQPAKELPESVQKMVLLDSIGNRGARKILEASSKFNSLPFYVSCSQGSGPPPDFVCSVVIANQVVALGSGVSEWQAGKAACEEALARLRKICPCIQLRQMLEGGKEADGNKKDGGQEANSPFFDAGEHSPAAAISSLKQGLTRQEADFIQSQCRKFNLNISLKPKEAGGSLGETSSSPRAGRSPPSVGKPDEKVTKTAKEALSDPIVSNCTSGSAIGGVKTNDRQAGRRDDRQVDRRDDRQVDRRINRRDDRQVDRRDDRKGDRSLDKKQTLLHSPVKPKQSPSSKDVSTGTDTNADEIGDDRCRERHADGGYQEREDRHDSTQAGGQEEGRGDRPLGRDLEGERPLNRGYERRGDRLLDRGPGRDLSSERRRDGPLYRGPERRGDKPIDRGPGRRENRPSDLGPDRRERPLDRGSERSENRTLDRGSERSEDRPLDRGSERNEDRPLDRGSERREDRPLDRGPERKERPLDRSPERRGDRTLDRGPERSEDRPLDRGPERREDRLLGRGPERREDRLLGRGPERREDRLLGRGPERREDRPLGRGPERSEDRTLDRGLERSEDRPLDRGPERREDRLLGRGPERREDRPLGRGPERREDRPLGRGPERSEDRTLDRGLERSEDRLLCRGPERREDRLLGRGPERREDRPLGRGPERSEDRTLDRGLERSEDRPLDRGPERREDRLLGRGPERREDRPLGRGPERREDRPLNRGPERREDRPLDRGPERRERPLDRGPERRERPLDRGPERRERLLDRGPERREERPLDRGPERREDRPLDRGPERREDRPLDRGHRRREDRPLDRGFVRREDRYIARKVDRDFDSNERRVDRNEEDNFDRNRRSYASYDTNDREYDRWGDNYDDSYYDERDDDYYHRGDDDRDYDSLRDRDRGRYGDDDSSRFEDRDIDRYDSGSERGGGGRRYRSSSPLGGRRRSWSSGGFERTLRSPKRRRWEGVEDFGPEKRRKFSDLRPKRFDDRYDDY